MEDARPDPWLPDYVCTDKLMLMSAALAQPQPCVRPIKKSKETSGWDGPHARQTMHNVFPRMISICEGGLIKPQVGTCPAT